jgi:hypothetical protein
MPPTKTLINFRINNDLNLSFEAKIQELNAKECRGNIILRGDKTRYIEDAIRAWIASH